ncbi:MAG: hypothetical protein ACTHJ9_04470 [Rhodanobacter sp.]
MSAEQIAEDLINAPAEFDARAHLRGASHAKTSVTVFTDGESAFELDALQNEIAKAEALAESTSAGSNGGITDSDGHEEALAEVEKLKEQEAALVEKLLLSKQVFTLRGVPTKLQKIIDRKARKEIKAPARKNFASGEEGEEEFELAVYERNLDRNDLVNFLTVAAAIVKVEDFHGNVDTKPWSYEDVEDLQGNLYDSEWYKILKGVRDTSAGQYLFSQAVERDADFLSKR